MKCRDDDGKLVGAGDVVVFSYGTPPVRVEGLVKQGIGCLWVLTPGHNPEATKLRSLRRYVGAWWKVEKA